MKFFAMCAVALLCGAAKAQTPASGAFTTLAKVEFCAVGGVGFVGRTSQGELNARILLAQPRDQAVATFKRLYVEGNPQAKCYALVALYQLDKSLFVELAKSIPEGVPVETMQGCIREKKSLAEVAAMISKDELLMRGPTTR